MEHVLTVDGDQIRVGTSLFDAETGEVRWYVGVDNGAVRLEGLEYDSRIRTDTFRTRVRKGELEVESRPPEPTTLW